MTGYIYDKSGAETRLPPLISWDICIGSGEPCDAFEICFAFERSLLKKLRAANAFTAKDGTETVFSGCIDEYEVRLTGSGATVSVCGRSKAALLFDNEAEAAEYTAISAELLLSRHVTPYGIKASNGGGLKTLSGFSVSQGESEWSVVKRYCSLCGASEPRFDPKGVLLLGEHSGKKHSIDDTYPITSIIHRDKRYGMISEVLVKNRSTGAKYGVRNQSFIDRGGSARRIIGVPKKTGADAMRYTAVYQIKQSARDKFTLTLGFAADMGISPGDKLVFDSRRLGLKGTFTVTEVRSFASALSVGSEVSMEVPL